MVIDVSRNHRGITGQESMSVPLRGQRLMAHFWRWLFRRGARRDMHGVPVAILFSRRADREALFEKIAAAFDLLARYGSRSLDVLRRHADGVFVFGTGGALAEWQSVARLVVLEERYVGAEATSVARLASTLVHEATHARLDHLGASGSRPFASGARWPSCLTGELERYLKRDPGYWTDEAFRERTAGELAKLGLPRWLVRTIERVSRRRAA